MIGGNTFIRSAGFASWCAAGFASRCAAGFASPSRCAAGPGFASPSRCAVGLLVNVLLASLVGVLPASLVRVGVLRASLRLVRIGVRWLHRSG
jgi:hypothetical protein